MDVFEVRRANTMGFAGQHPAWPSSVCCADKNLAQPLSRLEISNRIYFKHECWSVDLQIVAVATVLAASRLLLVIVAVALVAVAIVLAISH